MNKNIFALLCCSLFSNFAFADCVQLTGTWKGTCASFFGTYSNSLVIQQAGCDSFSIHIPNEIFRGTVSAKDPFIFTNGDMEMQANATWTSPAQQALTLQISGHSTRVDSDLDASSGTDIESTSTFSLQDAELFQKKKETITQAGERMEYTETCVYHL